MRRKTLSVVAMAAVPVFGFVAWWLAPSSSPDRIRAGREAAAGRLVDAGSPERASSASAVPASSGVDPPQPVAGPDEPGFEILRIRTATRNGAAGRPGVRVEIRADPGALRLRRERCGEVEGEESHWPEVLEAWTDDRGEVLIRLDPSLGPWSVRIRDRDAWSATKPVEWSAKSGFGTLSVEGVNFVTLRGTVVDPSGRAVEGARVYVDGTDGTFHRDWKLLFGARREHEPAALESLLYRATTDAAGAFSIERVPAGQVVQVFARAPGRSPTGIADITVAPDRTEEDVGPLALHADSGAHIAPVDESGSPVTGAQVWVGDLFGYRALAEGTPGWFEAGELAPGTHICAVIHPEFAMQTLKFQVLPGERTELQVTMTRGVVVAGRVEDHRGNGVLEATVELRTTVRHPLQRDVVRRVATGRLGVFTFETVVPDEPVEIGLVGRFEDTVYRSRDVLPPNAELKLPAPGGVRLRLVYPDGHRPAVPPEVKVHYSLRGRPKSIELRGSGNVVLDPETDRLTIHEVAEGAESLLLHVPGFVAQDLRVDILADDFVDLGDIRLEKGFPVTGEVLDSRRDGVRGVAVEVMDRRGVSTSTRTGTDGRFRFPDLPAGAAVLSAHDLAGRETRYALHCEPIEVGGGLAPLRIVLQRGGLILCVVQNASGRRESEPTIVCYPDGVNPGWASVPFVRAGERDEMMGRRPAGPARVRCLDPRTGGILAEGMVDVPEGGRVRILLRE